MNTIPRYADRTALARALKCHERTISRAIGEQSFSRKCTRVDFRSLCRAIDGDPAIIASALNGGDELLSVRELAKHWEMDRDEVRYIAKATPVLRPVARLGRELRFSRNAVFGVPVQHHGRTAI